MDDILTIGDKPGKIIEALAAARRALKAPDKVTKSMGKEGKQSYREIDDVVAASREALNSVGVVMTIRGQEVKLIDQNRAWVVLMLVFTASDGSRLVHETAAGAINGMGKAIQCAETAAVKQGLRYVLMIATGEGETEADDAQFSERVDAFMRLVYTTPLDQHRAVLKASPEHAALTQAEHRICQRLYEEYLKTERAQSRAISAAQFIAKTDDDVSF